MLLVILLAVQTTHGALYWGVPDTTASAGSFFNFSLPPGGDLPHLEVSEAGETRLPVWLRFDPVTRQFQGVPLSGDTGQHYIGVRAFGPGDQLVYKDVFSIEVVEPVRTGAPCPGGQTQPRISVSLSLQAENLDLPARLALLEKFSKFAGLPLESVRLESGSDGAVAVTWPAGCGAEAGASLKVGGLEERLGVPVAGWTLSAPPSRSRRGQPVLAATPIPGVPSPSRVSMGPESRVIPTMASPVVTHRIRHHHTRVLSSPLLVPLVSSVQGTPVLVPEVPLSSPLGELTPTPVLPPSRTFVAPSEASEIMPTSTLPSPVVPTKKPTVPNFKPIIHNRVKKLSMYAGKTWSYRIPQDTFYDMEDGDTRKLRLMFLTSEHTAISPSNWIQFDPARQVLYAMPLEEHIGKYDFVLEAMDSESDTTFEKLEIHVWQLPSARAVHHELSMSLRLTKYQYLAAIDWQRDVVRRLAQFYGDKNESAITVRSVTTDLVISWTNDSLPLHPCPRQDINSYFRKLKSDNGEITKSFRKMMGSDIKVQDITLTFLGVCQTPASTTQASDSNFSPMLRNPIEHINTTVGEILRFKVPDDTFYDFEEGNTRYLTLSFLTIDGIQPPKSSWVHFNPKSQELYGLPFDSDAGRHEFQMVAQDNHGLQINDAFVIMVHARPPKKWSVEFSIHLQHNYEEFSKDISKKVLVAWKLAKLYHDLDPRFITVSSISKGSVVYAWTNNTLPYDPCPKRTISYLVKQLFNENGTISNRLIEAMHPEFKIMKADAMPLGICLGEVTPRTVTVTPPPRVGPPVVPTAVTGSQAEDIFITTVAPAVVVGAALVLAASVACALYRQRRRKESGPGASLHRGIPIIFSDELDDRPDPAKPPVIMRDEKPPLSAPDHLRQPEDPSPPYQPPPPFTVSSKNSRPKATPLLRQPPPYDVPP